jgi:aminopeptidase N
MINLSTQIITRNFYISCLSVILIILSACKAAKKDSAEAIVQLPEVAIHSKPEAKTYYASYTRLSDITHTKLEINLNWDSCFVIGKATLKVRPYFYDTDELILDAKGYKINEVKINSKKADYTYDGYKLNIKLGKKYTKEETYEAYIDYVAMPNKIKIKGSSAINADKGFYFINPDGKNKYKPTQFWTQGETESNSCWFPTIESGNERFSQEIAITVDTAMVTLSNGRMMYSTNNSNGTRTDYWRQDLPHAPYLTMLAGGNFKIYKDKWRNMEVNYYMEPEFASNAKLIFGNTPEMIEFFSNKTGVTYPWDKYSQIVVRDFVSGAMENTGAVTFYDPMNKTVRDYEDQTDEDIISHELFHHWFGDLVTCESWPNLTLNEGFATYGEYLWDEYKYGREEADKGGFNNLNAYLASASSKRVNMIRFDLTDRESMFDVNSYQKGGQIIHMLRKYVGDKAFFDAIKLYLETYKFKPVEIHHLRLTFEEVTGEDLNWFFNQWYLNQGHPELEINYEYVDDAQKTIVSIAQKQDLEKNPLYRLPLDVDVYENGKVQRKRIVLDSVSQRFEFATSTKPLLINVDAEKMLVCTKKDMHSKEEWLYMFNNAPLFLDKLEALEALDKFKTDSMVQLTFLKALSDPFYSIKTIAISKVKSLNAENQKAAYPKLINLAMNDKKSIVRARALKVITEVYTNENNADVFASAEKDLSYSVETNLLKHYASTQKEKAWVIAKKEESTNNSSMQNAIAEFYAKEGTPAEHSFYLNILSRKSGFSIFFIVPHYKTYIKRMEDETIKAGMMAISESAKNTTNTFVRNSLKGILRDMKSTVKSDSLKDEIQKEIDAIN